MSTRIISIFASVCAVMLVSGCVSTAPHPEQMQPPAFDMAAGPKAKKAVMVKVQNGAGEVLVETKPGEKGKVKADPDIQKYDGELAITTTWSDGTTSYQRLTHPVGRPVDVGWSAAKEEYYLKTNEDALIATAKADSNPPVSVEIVHGKIDGARNVQYSGPADPYGEYDVDPYYGPITITTTFKNGEVKVQEIVYEDRDIDWDDCCDDEWVPFWWNPFTRQYVLGYHPERPARPILMAPQIRWRNVEVAAGKVRDKAEASKIGVYPIPGDPAVLKGPSRISGSSLRIRSMISTIKRNVVLDLGLAKGNDRKRIEVDPATNAGFLFWDQGAGLSAGLSGAGGWNASIKTKFSDYFLNLWNPSVIKVTRNGMFRFGPEARLEYYNRKSDGFLEYQALPNIFTDNDIELDEYSLSLGGRIEANVKLTQKWNAKAGLSAGLDYTRAKLDATQDNSCGGFCVDNRVNINDDWKKFGIGTRLNASLSYRLNEQSSISVEVEHRYKEKSPVIKEKIGMADDATHLDDDSRDESSMRLSYNFRF